LEDNRNVVAQILRQHGCDRSWKQESQKKQLQIQRGGSGRKGKTAIGAGEGGNFDNFKRRPGGGAGSSGAITRLRALVCERNEIIQQGMAAMIHSVADVVGCTGDGIAALELIRKTVPNLVITDVNLERMNGLALIRRACMEVPAARIVVATDMYHATKHFHQLYRNGAMGYCLKSSGSVVLLEAIELADSHLPYCEPQILQFIKQDPGSSSLSIGLTDQEIEVLIRLDMRNKEISDELDLKLRKVESCIESLLAKLAVPTRYQAALKAVQLGFVMLPKMPGRDQITGITYEHSEAERHALDAIERLREEQS
jgi:DNA-binding NarL/FixJ family response regulator